MIPVDCAIPSDVADEEWAVTGWLIPRAERCGNKRMVVEREAVNGLMYTSARDASAPRCLRLGRRAAFQEGFKQVCGQIDVEIINRSDAGKFVVLPTRWIVKRTIAWPNRCHRLTKDWERLSQNALAT